MLATLRQLADAPISASLSGLETAADKLVEDFAGWRRIAATAPAHLHPWAER